MGHAAVLEVQRLCPKMFDGINPNTPHRWKWSAPRAAPLGKKGLLSPADMTLLSEHIMGVTDVLCLCAVTIRSLVLEWLDAEGLLQNKGNSERTIAVLSQEFMAGEYRRQIVRSDGGSSHGQPCETGDLGDDGRWAVRSHPRADVERLIS